MRAMILAAGRGERLRPLTDTCPKPLVKVGGKSLIEYHIEKLKKCGITEIVINLHHLGEKIEAQLGNGQTFGVNIVYSKEEEKLEVGGGINQALPLLGDAPFLIVNSDIWTDYDFNLLPSTLQGLAHLVLVKNPHHNIKGDFALNKENGQLHAHTDADSLTYAGIALLTPALFNEAPKQAAFRLAPILQKALQGKQLFGEIYEGQWQDVGTVERLQALENIMITHYA